ncbi:MAG: IS5 family transposase [Actinobacteria bacterium]|nr:IS5 family transposase [Actinomycetota bacterium]MCA1701386.1 IS5 family transposase [Actinomycetota bacterium]
MSTKRRYPTDLTDRQWELVGPLLPSPPRGPAGRKPRHDKREIVNAILYQVRAGGAWRMLPGDLPPWQTVYGYFRDWRADGTLDRLHDALRQQVRTTQQQRNPEPSAGIVDSQSVKGADTVCAATRGYDAGKKINGRKRHIVVDTIGLLLVVMVSAASIQDRDGGRAILKALHDVLASVRHIFADGGYQGQLVAVAKSAWGIVIEVVRKPPDQRGFAVLPRRWVVERTFSWLMRFRRLVRDYERLPATHEAIVKWAMVAIMLNRLAPPSGPRPWSSTKTRK